MDVNPPVPGDAPAPDHDPLLAQAAIGRQAWARGDIAGAEAAFLAAWSHVLQPPVLHPYAQSLASGLVAFYLDTHQLDKAEQWIDRMVEVYGAQPERCEADFLRARVAFERGDFPSALHAFQALLSRYGRRPFDGEDPKYLRFVQRGHC